MVAKALRWDFRCPQLFELSKERLGTRTKDDSTGVGVLEDERWTDYYEAIGLWSW